MEIINKTGARDSFMAALAWAFINDHRKRSNSVFVGYIDSPDAFPVKNRENIRAIYF
jgi:hypothetical protein